MLDHPLGRDVRLPERDLHAEAVHQARQRDRERVGVGVGAELAGRLPVADDVGDQLALPAVELEVRLADGRRRAARGPRSPSTASSR